MLYTSPTGGLRRALVAFDPHHGDVGVAQSLTCLCVSLCMMRRCRCAVLASGAVSAALSPVTWVGRGAWGGGGTSLNSCCFTQAAHPRMVLLLLSV